MWELLRRRTDPSDGVVALVDHGGILVSGRPELVDGLVARLTDVQGARSRRMSAADLAMAASSAVAAERTSHDYVKLSPNSWDLLRRHGAIPGEDGYFRMFVQDGTKKIAGQLQWDRVTLGAEQALSLQVSAVGLALRAAILDVQQSVERVEAKLDHVTKLLRAGRRGDALGDHRTLTTLVERVRRSGQMSVTDWTSIAPMGPEIGRDLEGLRAHIRTLLERENLGRTTWGRAGVAEQLLDEDWLAETLALLAVVEHNFAMWQELRLAHVRQAENQHLIDTIADANSQLQSQRQSDQQLLDGLVAFATEVADPRLLDGLDPLNANRLVRARNELDQLVRSFADQRLLDAEPLDTEPFPKFRDSARHLRLTTTRGIAGAANTLGRVIRRSKEPDQAALPPSSDEPEG